MHGMFLECKNGLDAGSHDAEVLRYLREQRHNFINHIQVIWGYLQLNKSEQAKEYIDKTLIALDVIGRIFKIDNPSLSLLLYNNVLKAYKLDIAVCFEADLDFLNKFCDDNDDMDGLLCSIDKCFTEILNNAFENNCSSAYIAICARNGMLHIMMSSSDHNGCADISEGIQNSDSGESPDDGSIRYIKVYRKSRGNVLSVMIEVKPQKA